MAEPVSWSMGASLGILPGGSAEDMVFGVWRCRAGSLGLDGHQKATSCGERGRPSWQAEGTARARLSAVLTARFPANWPQRAWWSAAAGKRMPD